MPSSRVKPLIQQTVRLAPSDFLEYIKNNNFSYFVLDTETLGYQQAELFYKIRLIMGAEFIITKESLLEALTPQVILTDKIGKNGAILKTKKKELLYPTHYTPLETLLQEYGFSKGAKGWGVSNVKKLDEIIGDSALCPDKSFIAYIQAGVYCKEARSLVYACFPNTDVSFSTEFLKAVFQIEVGGLTTPIPKPLVLQNADFDLRHIYKNFRLLPPKNLRIHDTQQIESLYNAYSDFTQSVSLKNLCQKYSVPEEYAKCPVSPITEYWLQPSSLGDAYARNDLTAVCWVYEEQQTNVEWWDIQPTLRLESSIRACMAKASVDGLPVNRDIAYQALTKYTQMLTDAFDAFVNLLKPYYGEVPVPFNQATFALKETSSLYLDFLHWLKPTEERPKSVSVSDLLESGFIKLPDDQHVLDIAKAAALVRSISSKISNVRGVINDSQDGFLHPEYVSVSTPKAGQDYNFEQKKDTSSAGQDSNDKKKKGTASGRFSTTRYPVLNRNDTEKQYIVAPEGYKILCFDYSGIELRVAASLSGDESMTNIFNTGSDPYRELASRQFGIPVENIGKKSRERTLGKVGCLAYIYLGTPYTYKSQLVTFTNGELSATLEEAEQVQQTFFSMCPKIKSHGEDAAYEAAHIGYYKTVLGRKRKFNKGQLDADRASNFQKGWSYKTPWQITNSKGEVSTDPQALMRYSHKTFKNNSNNHKFQGSASEAFKMALAAILWEEYGWYLIAPTHDEIALMVPDAHLEYATYNVPETMLKEMRKLLKLDPCSLPITLEVEGTIGQCWSSHLLDPSLYIVPKDTPNYYQQYLGRWSLPYDSDSIIRY